jgi:GNAT superfamily N-acetyltransferase
MYRFTRISEANLADLHFLMRSAYSVALSKDQLRDKFATRAQGAEYVGFLAHHEATGAPAAFYGVFPVRVRLGAEEILAAQSGDTVTHPDHRGKGLFVKLAKLTFALATESGIKFVFGYPNANSYPGFVNKLGWQHPFNMKVWNYYLPTFPLSLVGRRFPVLSDLQQRMLIFLMKKVFDFRTPYDFVDEIKEFENAPGVIHDRAFAEYKLKRGFLLQHKSAMFWMKFDGDLCFGAITDRSGGKDLRSGIRRIAFLSMLTGIFRLKSYFSPKSELAKQLSGMGVMRESLAYGFVAFNSNIDPASLETVYLDYDTF